MSVNYIIISPVRDEEAYLEKTVESLVSQTIRPSEWVIVNDGSTDRTGETADRAAKEHPWIKVIIGSDRVRKRVFLMFRRLKCCNARPQRLVELVTRNRCLPVSTYNGPTRIWYNLGLNRIGPRLAKEVCDHD